MGKKYDDGLEYYQIITQDGLVDNIPQKKKECKNIHCYRYQGSVKRFDKHVLNLSTETIAVSEKQARNNILYQAKKRLGMMPYCGGFTLTNDIEKVY